jgi:hypothetical protein
VSIQSSPDEERPQQRVSSTGADVVHARPLWKLTHMSCRYIKELADRLNTLENSIIQPPPGDGQYASQMEPGQRSPRASEEYSPSSSTAPWASKQVRKRTQSGTNELASSAYVQSLPQRASTAGWSAQDAPRHLPHPVSTLQTPRSPHATSPGGDPSSYNQHYRSQLSPTAGHSQSLWSHGAPDRMRNAGSHSPYESNESRLSNQEQNTAILDWHEETVDE